MTREEFSLFDVAKIVWKRKKTIITVVSIVTILSLVFSFLLPKWYKATSVIVSERSSSGLNIGAIAGQFGLGGMLSGGDETQSRYIAILNSASKYNKETMMKTIEVFSSNYSVGLGDEMQVSISIIDKDQEIVFDMVNYTVEALDSLNIALSTGSAHNKRIFIEKQIKDIQDTLLNIEHELIKIMKDEDVISLEDQVKVGVEKAAELRSSIIMKEVELEVAEKTFQAESPQIIQLKNELES
jgi:tyrosine-protein kinase Etk/Wzc